LDWSREECFFDLSSSFFKDSAWSIVSSYPSRRLDFWRDLSMTSCTRQHSHWVLNTSKHKTSHGTRNVPWSTTLYDTMIPCSERQQPGRWGCHQAALDPHGLMTSSLTGRWMDRCGFFYNRLADDYVRACLEERINTRLHPHLGATVVPSSGAAPWVASATGAVGSASKWPPPWSRLQGSRLPHLVLLS
jgi:hypothetical protein